MDINGEGIMEKNLCFEWKRYDNSFYNLIDEKKFCIKRVNTFLNHVTILEQTLMSKWIYLTMQQKQI